MRTTTVVWRYQEDHLHPPEMAKIFAVKLATVTAKLIEIRGSSDDNLVSEQINANTKTVVRSWPDLATATAWVEYIQGIDSVLSAQVDPE